MPVRQLLGPNLGLAAAPSLETLDLDPPIEILSGLAERTGTDLERVRAMTLAGWVPWLFDILTVTDDGHEVFRNYVRGDSVLLAHGRRRLPQPHRPWRGPWLPGPQQVQRRVCPVCVSRSQPRRSLIWDLPLTVSCIVHGCRLEPDDQVTMGQLTGNPVQPVMITEPLATLDGYTQQALTTGEVRLPGRTVHAGVWFRLLRILLDELTLAPSTLGTRSRQTIESVWHEAGLPIRCAITAWQPYEQLPWRIQQQLLLAAAVALQQAAEHRLTARGSLAAALSEQLPKTVYDGDRANNGGSWSKIVTQAEEVLRLARTNAKAAQNLFAFLTAYDKSAANCEKQHKYLIEDVGVPPVYLATCPGQRVQV